MAKKESVVKKKLSKGKTWYSVIAPKAFNNTDIGETIADSSDFLKGRVINLQYSAMSGDVTKHFLKAKLRITGVEGEKAHTELIGYEISKPFLQRMIRRRSSKLDDVIDLKIKDRNIRIKTIAITVKIANASQRTALRKAIKTEILKNFREFTFDNLALVLASGKPQKAIQKRIKIIFPVKFFDVRKMEILPERKVKKDLGNEKIEEVIRRESKRTGKKIRIESDEVKEEPKEQPEPEVEVSEAV